MRLTLTSIAALMTAPAFAGGLTEPAPIAPILVPEAPVTFAPRWTGGYVGAQVGYLDATATAIGADGAEADFEGDGVTYGLRSGYDYQFANNLVLGVGLQYDAMDIELGDDVETLDSVLRAGGRVGFGLDRNLIYVAGGYARADTETLGDSDGYYAGLGYERFITESVTIGAEVLYHDFEDFDGVDIDADATAATLSVNYRF